MAWPMDKLVHVTTEREGCCILDILLAIEEQAQQGTEEMFDSIAGDCFNNIPLKFLRSEVRK